MALLYMEKVSLDQTWDWCSREQREQITLSCFRMGPLIAGKKGCISQAYLYIWIESNRRMFLASAWSMKRLVFPWICGFWYMCDAGLNLVCLISGSEEVRAEALVFDIMSDRGKCSSLQLAVGNCEIERALLPAVCETLQGLGAFIFRLSGRRNVM